MTSPITLDELCWLRRELHQLDTDHELRGRLADWLDRVISQRAAQKSKSRTDWHHADLMEYHAARQADIERVERNAGGKEQHPTEYAEEIAANPPITFHRWLAGRRHHHREDPYAHEQQP